MGEDCQSWSPCSHQRTPDSGTSQNAQSSECPEGCSGWPRKARLWGGQLLRGRRDKAGMCSSAQIGRKCHIG